jgi:hypothetical protein
MKFYKLLRQDLTHYGFRYREGLNVDTEPFNPRGDCEPGGLYYTSDEHLEEWIGTRIGTNWSLIADVTLPSDAQVYPGPCGTKWKADRLVLSNIRPLVQFLMRECDAARRCNIFKEYPHLLADVQLIEPEALEIIQLNPCAIAQIREPSVAICLAAVRCYPDSLRCIRNQTEEVCIEAVSRQGRTLRYVDIPQTEAMCWAAIKNDPTAFQFVHHQTEALSLAAVQGHGTMLTYVTSPTYQIRLAAVQNCGYALQCIPSEAQNQELCWAAVLNHNVAWQWCKYSTAEMFYYANFLAPSHE